MKKREQRLTVIHTLNQDGTVNISLLFYPPIAKSEAEFDAMPIERRILNNAASDSGRGVIESISKRMAK